MEAGIRILLADDHPTLRLGLRVLLEQAPEVEGIVEAEDGEQALAQIEALLPDVAVLDCRLPKKDGIRVAWEIRQRGLPVRVLALSAYDEARYLWGMWAAGALGYRLKSEPPDAIAAAVRAVARGASLWTPDQIARAHRWWEEVEQRWQRLTEREREVLAWVARGKSNAEIARALQLTERTVEFHMSNILSKLQFSSRLEAALWVKEHKLCE